MFLDPAKEKEGRDRALADSVQQAEQQGLSAEGAHCLRNILSRRVDTFRRALCGDPPARVEPMRVQLKPQAIRSGENRVAGCMHRSFGGVGSSGEEHPGCVGESGDGGAEKGHIPSGQRPSGGERASETVSGGDAKPTRHAGVAGSLMLRQVGPATGVLTDASGAGGSGYLHDRHAGRFVHTYSCPAGRVERHGAFPRCAD
ncbi:unnamed protein product [Sphacelaria rigidula]